MGSYLIQMGAKFYRGSDKGKKIRYRFAQTRSWFRGFKWVAYHAHPTYVAGHPFKGGWVYSTGQLEHPDLKRFQIETPMLFKPTNPVKRHDYEAPAPATPSFANFFASYFGNAHYSLTNPQCSKMLANMKNCYESNSDNADHACEYYVNGFRRMACSN